MLTIAVIGLGYVGLPLAVGFASVHQVIGFDTKPSRISALRSGRDDTLEVPESELRAAPIRYTSDSADLAEATVYIVTVPTPIDDAKQPDLTPLRSASTTVGQTLKPGDTVIYESTVYPGCTEEVCVPILEAESGLTFNEDFTVGYSPERINPGDHTHRLPDIQKVTSGSTPEAADFIDNLYSSIITAGTHRASSIRVAEAAKVIENTQRDVNIALINELAVLFNQLGIDTREVLEAAGTKWNFLPFHPGLVGGHCIGVDPYYLTHKAQQVGHHPEVILAGRRINDSMGAYVADQLILTMARSGLAIAASRVLILGLAFKENCPDLRNTKVVDIIVRLRQYGVEVDVSDPWVDPAEAQHEYGLNLIELESLGLNSYSGAVLAVQHDQFTDLGPTLRDWIGDGIIYDVKGQLGQWADARL